MNGKNGRDNGITENKERRRASVMGSNFGQVEIADRNIPCRGTDTAGEEVLSDVCGSEIISQYSTRRYLFEGFMRSEVLGLSGVWHKDEMRNRGMRAVLGIKM